MHEVKSDNLSILCAGRRLATMTACMVFPTGSFRQRRGIGGQLIALEDEDPGYVKRPMNAFMVWSTKRRKILSHENPALHNKELSKRLGVEWKALSEEEKRPYIKDAQELRERHKADHPDYKYATNKRRKLKETPPSSCYMYSPMSYAAAMARMGGQPVHIVPPPLHQHQSRMAALPMQIHQLGRGLPAWVAPPEEQGHQHSITTLGNSSRQQQVRNSGHPVTILQALLADSSTQVNPEHALQHTTSLAGTSVCGQPPTDCSVQHATGNSVRCKKGDSVQITRPPTACIADQASQPSTATESAGQRTTDMQAIQPPTTSFADHSVQVIQHATAFADSSVQVSPVEHEPPAISHAVQDIKSMTSFTNHTVQIKPVQQQPATSSEEPVSSSTDPEDDSVQIIAVEGPKTSCARGKSASAGSIFTPVRLIPIVNAITSPRVASQSDVGITANIQQQGFDYVVHKAILQSSYRSTQLAMLQDTAEVRSPDTVTPLAVVSKDIATPLAVESMDMTTPTQVPAVTSAKETDKIAMVSVPVTTATDSVPGTSSAVVSADTPALSASSNSSHKPSSLPMPPLLLILPSPVQATPTPVVPVTSHVWTQTSHTVTPTQARLEGKNFAIWSAST